MKLGAFSWMAFLFLMALLIPPQTLHAQSHHVPSTPTKHGPNLPLVGSSLFDKIYSRALSSGERVYDVPFPLPRLLKPLEDLKGNVVYSLFPFSRSLQRPQDLSYNPLSNPRIVLAANTDQDSLTRAKLFIGYVKAKDQLEVISYNDEAGRFEYQIVTDYSQNPQVFYAERGKCLTCHQGQAPIFSTPGWQDSSFGVMGQLLLTQIGTSEDTKASKEKLLQYLFGPVKAHDEVAVFDLLVRESNQIAMDERIWVHGCAEDKACRLGLLLHSLSPNSHLTAPYLDHSRQVLKNSELQTQTHFHSFLTPTSMGALDTIDRYGSALAVAQNPKALLEMIGKLYNLRPPDNPATPRPYSLKSKDLTMPLAGFSWYDKEILRQASPNQEKVAEILVSWFQNGSSFLTEGSINKPAIMESLLRELGSPKADIYAYWRKKESPPKQLFQGPLPPVFQQRELNIFSRHCHQCHAVGLAFPPQFLLGNEKDVLEKMRGLKSKIIFKLENNLMPPNPSDQELLKTSGDYETILKFIESL